MIKKVCNALFNKRILYLLCFLGINLIEFLKATQDGDIWYVAVNFTGIAMFVMIASTYSRKELWNWFNGVCTIVCGAVMGAVYYYKIASPENYFHLGQVESAILNVWWIVIALRVVWTRYRQAEGAGAGCKATVQGICRKISKIGWLWIGLMVLMTLAVNDRIWPLWYLLMFGIFYLTNYSEEERKALWDGMLNGTILSFFGFQIFAYATRPYDVVRYVGFYENSNSVALYYLIIYTLILCKLHILHVKKSAVGWKIFYLIGAGGLLCFQIFTMCRTAWIASVLVTLVYGIVVLRGIWQDKWGKVLLRGVLLGVMVVVTFLPVFYTIRWLPTLTHYRVWLGDEYSVDKVHSFDPADSEKYIELDEFLEECIGRVLNTLKSADAANPLVLQAKAQAVEGEGADVDDVPANDSSKAENWEELVEVSWSEDLSTRIRLTIYKAYLRDMTWIGNSADMGRYVIGDGSYTSWHGQNLWIQIGYYFGIPAMILLGILTVALLVWNRKRAGKGGTNAYAVIPLLISVIFFSFGLLEAVWNPGLLILFLMFFVQHPQLSEGHNNGDK